MTVSLIPRTDMAPVPRVEIVVEPDDLPSGTDRVTLWRVGAGVERKVRGGVDRSMGSALSLIDYEPGRGMQSSYEAECWDGAVSLGRVALGSADVPWVGDARTVTVQQPLDPNLSLEVYSMGGAWPSLTQVAPGELVTAEGAGLPTFVGGGPISGMKEVVLDFGVPSREAAQRLRATLGTPEARQLPVWLVRGGNDFLPRVFFCRVQTLVEVDVNNRAGLGWSRFVATVDEVAPPAPGLVVASLSYDDLDAAFESYDDRDAAYPSYDAMDRDYSLAGLSG